MINNVTKKQWYNLPSVFGLGLFLVLFFGSGHFAKAETITYGTQPSATADALGNDSAHQARAESFTLSNNASAVDITAFAKVQTGAPGDNFVVSIYNDSGGNPTGSLIGSVSVAGSSLPVSCDSPTSMGTITASFTAGTTYWFVFSRSGAVDGSNYYFTCQDPGNVSIKQYGGSWASYAFGYVDVVGVFSATATVTPEQAVFPGHEASTTFQVVDNPNQDVANALYLFLFGFFGTIWLLTRRT